MACLLFTAATGTRPTLVAYRGTGPAMNDLVGGHVDFFCEQAVSVAGQITSGTIKAYAVSSSERLASLPNVPTAKELGYEIVGNSPYGLVGPKGMEPAVMKTLHDGFKKAMDEPKHQEVLDQLNQDPWYRTGDDYLAWAKATYASDRALIERLGLLAK